MTTGEFLISISEAPTGSIALIHLQKSNTIIANKNIKLSIQTNALNCTKKNKTILSKIVNTIELKQQTTNIKVFKYESINISG